MTTGKESGNRLEVMEKVRACARHKMYVAECPACNIEHRAEKHTDHARKKHVLVPVYRVVPSYGGKKY